MDNVIKQLEATKQEQERKMQLQADKIAKLETKIAEQDKVNTTCQQKICFSISRICSGKQYFICFLIAALPGDSNVYGGQTSEGRSRAGSECHNWRASDLVHLAYLQVADITEDVSLIQGDVEFQTNFFLAMLMKKPATQPVNNSKTGQC